MFLLKMLTIQYNTIQYNIEPLKPVFTRNVAVFTKIMLKTIIFMKNNF